MGKENAFVRPKLLQLIDVQDVCHFTAHYLKSENSWVCFSQLRLRDETKTLAGHFNLPKHLVKFTPGEPTGRCRVTFTAAPKHYLQKGVKEVQ